MASILNFPQFVIENDESYQLHITNSSPTGKFLVKLEIDTLFAWECRNRKAKNSHHDVIDLKISKLTSQISVDDLWKV